MDELSANAAGAKLDRRAAVARLLERRGELLLVSGLGAPTYDCTAAGDDARNFPLWGAMGGAAMVGLGLAIAQPARPVLVVTGDGEQLMGLGALATIGAQRPANLGIVVLDNGHYGETGMQRSHTLMGVDLVGVAKACGFAWAEHVERADQIAGLRARIARREGLGFASVRIAANDPPRVLPSRDGVEIKNRFRRALGFPTI